MEWHPEKLKELGPLLNQKHFVVLDIETTGLSPDKGGRIIEIAAVRVLNGQIKDTYETFVDPQMKIPKKTTEITSITTEMVKGKPTIYEVLPSFFQFINNAVVVAHNATFDWDRFLVPYFKKAGLHPNNDKLCTMKTLKRTLPGRGRGGYTLDEMCRIFNVSLENHHRAIDDVKATAECLIGMIHLFATPTNDEEIKIEKKQVAHTPVRIKQVRYWEKRKNPREMFRRQYIRLSTGKEWGTVFFDIPTRTWGNKDFPLPLDFTKIEKDVLEFLGLNSITDLLHFRN